MRHDTFSPYIRLGLAAVMLGWLATPAHSQRVVYEPTPYETVERMLNLAEVRAGDYLIDLGSGDGRIPIAAARRGARALGVEIDPELIRQARANAARAGVSDRVTFREEDLFKTALGEATVIALYLLPEMNERLKPSLLALRPGTRIVAHQFGIGDWQPDASDRDGGLVLFWIVPARVAGSWRVRYGEHQFNLALSQRNQELSGIARFADGSTPLREARLRGREIEFVADVAGRALRFRGTVEGNAIRGTARGLGLFDPAADWRAERP